MSGVKYCHNCVKWEWLPLNQISCILKGMNNVSNKWNESGNCKFVDYKNVYNNFKVDITNLHFATVSNPERQTILRQHDILITNSSETPDECGISSVVEEKIKNNIFIDDHLFGIRLNSHKKINSVYLNYYFKCAEFRKLVKKVVRGVTRHYISIPNFMNLRIPVPPLPVQEEIVRILDKFTNLTNEFKNELDLRKKQYEYYRDKLLSFDGSWVVNMSGVKYCPNGVKYERLCAKLSVNRGKRLVKNQLLDNGQYVVYHGSKDRPLGTYNKYNVEGNTVIVVNTGAIGGVKYCSKDFWCSDGCFWLSHSEELNVKFIYYYVSQFEKYFEFHKRIGGVPTIDREVVENLEIPVPPLPVQEEIVRILDKFTNLTNEFKNELDLRKKQYEYYRDKLLSFDSGGVKWKRLGDIGCFYGGLVGKSKSDFNKGNAKFITYKNVYSNMSVDTNVSDTVRIKDCENQHALHFGDICFTGSSETPCECGLSSVLTKFPKEPLYLNSFCFFLRLKNLSEINVYYLKYLFRSDEIRKKIIKTANGVTRFNISKELMKNLLIPIPPLSVQKEIVEKLDRFNELCNEVTKGLPAEIQMREKQYEYYRDKLLSFKVRNV